MLMTLATFDNKFVSTVELFVFFVIILSIVSTEEDGKSDIGIEAAAASVLSILIMPESS